MFLIDLNDAYFQIPVRPESRLFLRFCLWIGSSSSIPYVLVCPWPRRSSPEFSLWFRSGCASTPLPR